MERATVEVYEERAAEWTARRSRSHVTDARRFASAVAPGAVRIDLGCGPGFHVPYLGKPLVAIDAARAMLDLAREQSPKAWFVQADLEAPPFRDGSLGGAWARASYLHVARARLPLALARLHWAMRPGAPFVLFVRHGDGEGALGEDGDFPGRFFAEWRTGALEDVLVGAGFKVDEVAEESGHKAEFLVARARRARTLPDTVGPGMHLLVCGLNPSVYAADRGVGYARPNNRFWPVALATALVTRDRDPLRALAEHRIGMTDLVKRATHGADELTTGEYRGGVARVERLVAWLRPGAVCFVGLAGWRAAVNPKAKPGVQPGGFGGVPAYVMPSTSGANARTTMGDLVKHLRAADALARG
ncbi:MAG TPA: methyltransferase domain-containing protein [Acidimicrobiia bacterium]|nr:methyltransferase domain-containing protein [Acidimicrobiia bacterium]